LLDFRSRSMASASFPPNMKFLEFKDVITSSATANHHGFRWNTLY